MVTVGMAIASLLADGSKSGNHGMERSARPTDPPRRFGPKGRTAVRLVYTGASRFTTALAAAAIGQLAAHLRGRLGGDLGHGVSRVLLAGRQHHDEPQPRHPSDAGRAHQARQRISFPACSKVGVSTAFGARVLGRQSHGKPLRLCYARVTPAPSVASYAVEQGVVGGARRSLAATAAARRAGARRPAGAPVCRSARSSAKTGRTRSQ